MSNTISSNIHDPWHYPRIALAEQVMGMFDTGLSSALVFFAPRRMGKTEFLLKDIMPLAESKGWQVLYFSFLDVGENAGAEFTTALATLISTPKKLTKPLLRNIKKISGEAAGIKIETELNHSPPSSLSMKKCMDTLATQGKVLLLMDEIQALTQHRSNLAFISSLRTLLDINKDNIKTIFTGSSREGLRRMFSQSSAPFFHFGQNLPFPTLDRNFVTHLTSIFKRATQRTLDVDLLWSVFIDMQYSPQMARALVERMVLNPDLSIGQAKQQLMDDISNDRAFIDIWATCSVLEQLLIQEIIHDTHHLFSNALRKQLAQSLGIHELSVPTIQSTLRTLQRKGLIGKHPERGTYFIDDPNFENWIKTTC